LALSLNFCALELLIGNGKAERKFQTLYGRIQAMLNGAGLEGELRDKIWAECVMNVSYLSNIISTKSSFKSYLSCHMVKNQNYTIILKCLVKLEW
jgi:hypothetical protein